MMDLLSALFYLIVEYMRPQTMYGFLSRAPLAFIAVGGMGVAVFLKKGGLKNASSINYFILAFLSWYLISFLAAYNKEVALQPMLDMLKIVVIYFLLINIINNRKSLYVFVVLLLLLNLKLVQHAILVWAEKGFYSDTRGLYEGAGFATGFLQNPNDFGVLLNVMFGISFYMMLNDETKIFNKFPVKWIHYASVVLIPLTVLATSSRAATLAFGFCLMAILFKSKRKMIATLLLALVAVGYVSLIPSDNWERFEEMGSETDKTGQARLYLWKSGINMGNENPITGVGPNNFIYVNQNVYKNGLKEVQHNVYIQALSELGYPGLILLLIMILACFLNQVKTRNMIREKHINDKFLLGLSHGIDVALIGFSVNGFFITVLYYPFLWNLMAISAALGYTVKKMEAGNRDVTGERKVVRVATGTGRPYLTGNASGRSGFFGRKNLDVR